MKFEKISEYYYESDSGYRITSTDLNHNKFIVFKKIKTNYKNRTAWLIASDCVSFEEAKKICNTDHWLNHGV